MAERAIVTALPEDEVSRFFEQIGLSEEYASGRLICAMCEEALSEAGLGAVRADPEGGFVFVCTKLDCLQLFHGNE